MKAAKVFGIGLSRTGTSSLAAALKTLGYNSLHWPCDPQTRSELMAYYSDRSQGLSLTVAREYDAVTDTPVATVYRELSVAYPASRFILTIRDQRSWLPSCAQFWSSVMDPKYRQCHPHSADREYVDYCKAVNTEVYGRYTFDPADFQRKYDEHFAHVAAWFQTAAHRLLVLDICGGQGWRELCAFLGCPEPEEVFPHTNRMRDRLMSNVIASGRSY